MSSQESFDRSTTVKGQIGEGWTDLKREVLVDIADKSAAYTGLMKEAKILTHTITKGVSKR